MSSEESWNSSIRPEQGSAVQLEWDDSNMKSSYANVCNAMSTREEVVLMFGMNQAWQGGHKEVTIRLTDRIILSPHAAKRLSLLLNNHCCVGRTEDSTICIGECRGLRMVCRPDGQRQP